MAHSVVERTLTSISGTLQQTLFAEDVAREPGVLQTLDPRVKLVGTLALLLAVSFARQLWVILALYALVLLIAWVSRIPMRFFVRHVWFALPFFTGLVALPVLFNVVTPGTPLLVLWQEPLVAITAQGLRSAAFLVFRVGTSISLAILLVLTTPWNTLLRALSVLRVPPVFLLILGMTYRYIYLLLRTTSDMFLARQSRIVGRLRPAEQRRVMTNTMGVLIGKSYDMSHDVYLAMLSRGYRGHPRTLDRFAMRTRDWLWGAGFLLVAVVALILGRG